MTAKVVFSFFLILLTGCASLVSKDKYTVHIHTFPTGASIEVKDRSGECLFRGKAPARVVLKAGRGYFKGAAYRVRAFLEGRKTGSATIQSSLDWWYFGNIILGTSGLLGFFIIDPLSGAMWRLDETIIIDLYSPEEAAKGNQ